MEVYWKLIQFCIENFVNIYFILYCIVYIVFYYIDICCIVYACYKLFVYKRVLELREQMKFFPHL